MNNIQKMDSNQAIILPSFITSNVSLKERNWFKTGGPARYFAQPKDSNEFQQALLFANQQNVPVFLLGEGANVLISDDGFDGLVICPQLKEMSIINTNDQHTLIQAGAGVLMHDLIDYCLAHSSTGLEEFSGIPGSVGGSIYINLHYFEFLLAQFLVSATVIDKRTCQLMTVDTAWFNFGYNHSTLMQGNHYLVDATFRLTHADDLQIAYARGRRVEIIRHRKSRYPKANTCGSFFRNFHEDEVTVVSNGKKMIYVAYYLDKIGVKGQLAVGGACVSYQHANMLVTQENASSTDVINLAREMQTMVFNTFGIMPQPECRLIGFKEYPLLK